VPLLGSSVALNVRKLLPAVYDASLLEEIPGLDLTTPEFEYVRSGGADGTEPPERNKRFDVSGQSFLRAGFGTKNEFEGRTWLSFNVGPWRSKHCHLDALAITYASDGVALLPDSGLYEYATGTDPDIDYFNGTRAHNTVVVDGNDQANDPSVVGNVHPGLLASGDDWAYESGSHGLYAGVTHARSLVLLAQDLVVVIDTLASNGEHDYVQAWHLWPDAEVAPGGALDIDASDTAGHAVALRQALPDGVTVRAIKGQDSPFVQGYYSTEYGVHVPNYALEYAVHGTGRQFVTAIASGARASSHPSVKAQVAPGGDIHVTVCAGDVLREVAIHAQAQVGETVSVARPMKCP
jgi:hypothetical protein